MSDVVGSELPHGWKLVPMADVLAPLADGRTLHQGWSPKCAREPSTSADVWGVLKTTAVQLGAFFPEHNKRLPDNLSPRPQIEVKPGDFLLTCAGPRSRCGIACLVRSTRSKLMMSGKMYRFRVPEEHVNPHFVEAFFKTSAGSLSIDHMKTGSSDSGLNLTQARFKRLKIPIAPLPEQCRIVAKLDELFSELDASVAALERAQAKLKRYRASVLKAAVEGKLTEEWRRKNPPDETGAELLQRILVERRQLWEQEQLAKFKAKGQRPPKNWQQKYKEPVETNTSELPELPEGWCWATVDQVSTTVKYGSSAKTSLDLEGVPVLRMGNIQEGTLNLERLKHLPLDHSEFPKLLLANGDLLFNRTNSAELVGKTAVYRGRPDPCSFASYLISVRMIRSCLSGVVANALNSSWGRAWIASVVSQQVGQANVNGTKLRAFTFPLPPETEQGEIISRSVDAVHSVTGSSHVIADLLQQAIALRQSILKRAFEGELVPQDPRDEPASLLLGRIRVTREVQRPKKKSRHSKTPVQRIQDP